MQKELQNPESQDASIFPPQNDRETIPVLEKVSFVSPKTNSSYNLKKKIERRIEKRFGVIMEQIKLRKFLFSKTTSHPQECRGAKTTNNHQGIRSL
jgi:hypothetical protein